MAIRRCTDSVYLQFIWDAIEIPSADHTCTFDHILRFIRTEKDPKCDVSKLREHLRNALRDNCVVLDGSQYKKPDWSFIQSKSVHDSYCFRCHLPGPVIDCPTCFRVFHEACLKRSDAKTFTDFPDEEYRDPNGSFQSSHSCVYCRRLSNTKISKETKSNLRNIYSIILEKMRGKNPWRNLYTVGYVEETNRNNFFCTKQMNTRIITEKLRSISSDGYPTRTHILADLDLLVHNTTIIYGSKAEMTATARSVRSTLQKELRESSLCGSCYMRSKGGRPDQHQIVKACPRPHELIWFQYGSWSFRPCKVLHKTDEGCEVVCFDMRRERLFAPTKTVFKMNTSPMNMGMRITPPLRRALLDVKKYVENQRIVTPNLVFEDSLLNCDVPPDSSTHSDCTDDFPEKAPRKSAKASSKRSRPVSSSSSKIASQPKFIASPGAEGTEKIESSLEKARVSTFHPALRDNAPSPNVGAFRSARIYSSESDSDENSASSSSSDPDSDYPPTKRPTYRSVAISPSAANVTKASSLAVPSSRSSDSTSPAISKNRATAPTTSAADSSAVASSSSTSRPFSSRAAVTDSDSDSASSPLESSGSPRGIRNSPLPICRKRNISSSSSSSSNDGENDESSSSTKSVLSSLTNSKNKAIKAAKTIKPARKDPTKTRSPNNYALGSAVQDSVSAKGLAKRVIKAVGGDSFAMASKLTSDHNAKCNSVPPVSHIASSISSVSPAALSSSSGIGSAASVDAKSVEASPGELLCNGHIGSAHTDSQPVEDHSHALNARTEIMSLQLDKANKRIQELERTIKEMVKRYKLEIENTKRHAWCRLCLKQSVYYCCPGTSYCSTDCQKEDWTNGHSKVCRRCNSQQ